MGYPLSSSSPAGMGSRDCRGYRKVGDHGECGPQAYNGGLGVKAFSIWTSSGIGKFALFCVQNGLMP